ncbi:hypothetical protein J4408_00680 [Candidatus Pacearchaeota archaeon]|nr:hypothetical protein [Candidatus Pacearchaeota archaeon]
MINKKGQVWVETVLYTLIGLALIALVLAFITPKVSQTKDKLAVEQTINSLNDFDSRIKSVLSAPGNVRKIEFNMRRGELIVDGREDKIVFLLRDLKEPYSEVDVPIDIGNVKVTSQKEQKDYSVELVLNYTGLFNLTYNENRPLDMDRSFAQAATPYEFSITNLGNLNGDGEPLVISIEESSSR